MYDENCCARCEHARSSPSGKIACGALNNPMIFGLSPSAPEFLLIGAIGAVLPLEHALYRGWGQLGRRPGQGGDDTVSSGVVTANVFLVDPTALRALFMPLRHRAVA